MITLLTYEVAVQHIDTLTQLANLIPEVSYTSEEILSDTKGSRSLHNKWQHSLLLMDEDMPVGFIMAYEREAEDDQQYPANTLYISELAVAETHQGQGFAKKLLRSFFEKNYATGFITLDGDLNYSLQTNSAEWNSPVVDLYKSFGFVERAIKTYPNRADIILGVRYADIEL
jgi:ribosomal protein S18 acetylase RimI-like enzyme